MPLVIFGYVGIVVTVKKKKKNCFANLVFVKYKIGVILVFHKHKIGPNLCLEKTKSIFQINFN